jgi:hypothetical protein
MKQISAKCNILAEIWFAVKIESRQLQNFGLIDTCGLDYWCSIAFKNHLKVEFQAQTKTDKLKNQIFCHKIGF